MGNPELVAKRITEAIGQADASSTLEEIFSAFRALLQALAQERPGAFDHGLRPFRFRHLLIQQSTYRAIPKRMRAELHERVAAWLEAKLGEESVEYAEIGGYHLEQTYHYRGELGPVSRHRDLARRAAKLLATAGRRAFGRGDMPASANLLQRAASLLPADDCARLELLNDLGYALFEVGELERANAVLSESIDGGRRRGDPAIEWTATVKLAHARMYTNPEEQDTDALIQLAESGVRYDLAHLDVLDDQARAIPRQRPGRLRLRPRIRRKALEAAGLRTLSLMASAASSDFRARRSVAKA